MVLFLFKELMTKYDKIALFLKTSYSLTDLQTRVYIEVLKRSRITFHELSTEMSISNSTLNEIIKKLRKIDLISASSLRKKSSTVYSVTSSSVVQNALEEKMNNAINLYKNSSSLVKEIIKSRSAVNGPDTQVLLFSGKNDIKNLYMEILEAKEIRVFVNTKAVEACFPGNIHMFVREFNNRNETFMWEIFDHLPENKEYINSMDSTRYKWKIFPKEFPNPDFFVYDDKLAILEFHPKPIGIIIKSANLARMLVTLFDFIWSNL